jgi:hypothetical protein
MGMFRVFQGKTRRNFSAVKTCRRSEWDSNLRYLFETSKGRRVPNLRIISTFKNSSRLLARRAVALATAISEEVETRIPGDFVAETWSTE